jgi:hypothetical protein
MMHRLSWLPQHSALRIGTVNKGSKSDIETPVPSVQSPTEENVVNKRKGEKYKRSRMGGMLMWTFQPQSSCLVKLQVSTVAC